MLFLLKLILRALRTLGLSRRALVLENLALRQQLATLSQHGRRPQANVHCYAHDSVEIRRYLAVRDRLRAHADERAWYEATKRELAQREWKDVNYYAEAKGPVIRAILARAGCD